MRSASGRRPSNHAERKRPGAVTSRPGGLRPNARRAPEARRGPRHRRARAAARSAALPMVQGPGGRTRRRARLRSVRRRPGLLRWLQRRSTTKVKAQQSARRGPMRPVPSAADAGASRARPGRQQRWPDPTRPPLPGRGRRPLAIKRSSKSERARSSRALCRVISPRGLTWGRSAPRSRGLQPSDAPRACRHRRASRDPG
jgi:hypothetical protein